MARIEIPKKNARDRLLEEGRRELRREMTQRFYARTPEWRRTYEHADTPSVVLEKGP